MAVAVPDILAGFSRETIALRPDHEGAVVATLVHRRSATPTGKAVLYLHGFIDYFFQTELAERYIAEGFDFYALDLRKYGRSLLPHQTPNFCWALDEYFEEIDEAVGRIRDRDGHSTLVLNGHSTGGLTGALYAHVRRGSGTIDACFFNSPFFDMNGSWLDEKVLLKMVTALGVLLPYLDIPGGLSRVYGESIHKDFRGEWDFRLDWKPIEGFPTRAGWIRAIRKGQQRLQAGLDIACPILVMSSTESSRPKTWDDVAMRTDAVLDVADMDRYAARLGADVTKVRIPGGIHDLVLSTKRVREEVYASLFKWLCARALSAGTVSAP